MAAGRLLVPGWSRALDSDGEPISARISLFLTETDSLASVYSDEALSVPLQNPVLSNSAGRFPAIWASDAVTYDWSVEAPYGPPGSPFTGTGLTTALAADVLAADAAEAAADAAAISETNAAASEATAQDILDDINNIILTSGTVAGLAGRLLLNGSNVGGNAATLRTNIGAVGSVALAAGTGGALVGVQSSIAGAGAQTLAQKLQQTINLLDILPNDAARNAVLAGSSTTDYSAVINLALATGKILVTPDVGRVCIASPLEIPSGGGIVSNSLNSFKIFALPNYGDQPLIRNKNYQNITLAQRDKDLFIQVCVDGNRANNATGTEFSHGIALLGVDGAYLNVRALNCKGDGVLLSYAYPNTNGFGVGCRAIKGFIYSEKARRMGYAVTCAEGNHITQVDYQCDLVAGDYETDNAEGYVRGCYLNLTAIESGQAASGFRGGFLADGAGGSGGGDISGNIVDLMAIRCKGEAGLAYRETQLVARVNIIGMDGNGIYGIESNARPSIVNISGYIKDPTSQGLIARGTGDIINGDLHIDNPANVGANIQNADGGTLRLRVTSSSQQGLVMSGTDDMIFPDCFFDANSGAGVLLSNSNRNRFTNLVSINSSFNYGFNEGASCNGNRVTNARMTGNNSGPAVLTGANSMVELEALRGSNATDPASIANGASGTISVTVTGAAVGDSVRATYSLSLAGLNMSAYVSAANTVTIVLNNNTGSAVDLAAGTFKAYVTPII